MRGYCHTWVKTIASGGMRTVRLTRAGEIASRTAWPRHCPGHIGRRLQLRARELVRSVTQHDDPRGLSLSPLHLDDVAGADDLQVRSGHGRPLAMLRAQKLSGAPVDLDDRHPLRLHLIGQARSNRG